MKLLLFIPSLGSGGAERQLVTLALLFKEEGYDVEFLIYHKSFFYKHLLDDKAIKINILESSGYLQRIYRVRKFIRNSSFDVVVSFLETPDFLNCFSSIGAKKWKVITTELSSNPSTFKSLKGKLFGWFRNYSDYIICNSYNARRLWESYYPNYSKKLHVIYNPVLLPEITSLYKFKSDNKLNLVIAASYQYLKNPIGLIQGVALLEENLRNKLTVNWYGRTEVTIGDSRAYEEGLELIRKNNLNDIVKFHGPTKDIANIMNSADVVGLFSELEGLPNAICEAMMIGKPIIMTKVSDYDFLVDESNGILCDWNDPQSIKFALEKILQMDKSSIIEMGVNSKIKAEKLFSSEKIVKQWIDFFIK